MSTPLNSEDAERLELLKLLKKSSGDDLEGLLQKETELIEQISAKRNEFFRRCRDVAEFEDALAGMGAA